MAAGRDEDEESDYAPGEEERLKNVKSAAVGIPAAAALLSLRESDEASQSKDFLWDQAVKLCASGMLVLTLLEVLSSIRGEAVKCLTPDNYTRDQGGFINAFCTQFTHRTDFFLFLLVAQAILVYGPHFLWSSVYFGKFRYFSALAFSLDRHRDSKTGEFDSKNFVTVRALMDTFGSTHIIYIMYVAKLFAQLVVAVVFIGICAGLFNEYNPAFDCPSNDSLHLLNDSWPLDEQIVCVLSSLNLLFPVWWANFVLLTGTVVASLCGLVWSGVLNHQTKLNWRHVAQFALQSGIQPSYYHPKTWRKRWFSKNFCSYRIRSNLDFLFLRLYRDDAGRAQVLREVLIAQLIKEQEQRLQERLSFLRRVGDESMCADLLNKVEKKRVRREEPERCDCKEKRAKPNQDLGNTLESVLCNFLTNPTMNLEYINAVDISFGSSGFKMLVAAMDDCVKVVSVNFDPHYLNESHSFKTSSFLSEIESFRTWSTIFSKEKKDINQLRDEIAKQFFDIQQLRDRGIHGLLDRKEAPTYEKQRANVVLVGPIPKKESQNSITVHWLLKLLIDHKLINKKCYLVTVRPCRVEDEAVAFAEFVPAWVSTSRRTGADKGEGGSNTASAEPGSEAQSASGQGDSSANSSDVSNRAREVAYLRYGSYSALVDGEQVEEVIGNHYFSSQCGEGTVQQVSAPNLVQQRNVLVECGSTQCEFEIKVYEIEESSYASRDSHLQASSSPQVADQVDIRSTPVVHNNLVQGTESSPPDSAQSCPQLYTESNSQFREHPPSHAQTSAHLHAVQSTSEIHYDESRHPRHAETFPQLHARNSSSSSSCAELASTRRHPTQSAIRHRSVPLGTLV